MTGLAGRRRGPRASLRVRPASGGSCSRSGSGWTNVATGPHIDITREVEDGWRRTRHVGLYRALPRAELATAVRAAGLAEPRWLLPAETGYHQPIMLARKPETS